MADEMIQDHTIKAVGLSVGATSVTAVTADTAVTRTPVLTFAGPHQAVVGLPLENPALPEGERGPSIGDFVDRVGDPVGILAADGSSHRAEMLLAEALRSLTYQAAGRQRWPDVAAVTYPAHWRPQAVTALQRALSQVPEWSRAPVPVLSDVAAAVTALQRDPGLPTRGVLAVCDFGGSGTSITLVDAGNGYQPIGATVRHLDFSGDLVDQALLTHVIGILAEAGAVDLASTSAIGSLSKLRHSCRAAKERLSAATVTALPVELPGHHSDVRLTRTELDDVLRTPLAGVLEAIADTLRHNGIRPGDLVAVATVGGGAATVAVTTTLSEGLRVPVITSPRPALAAATGAALRALRGPADDSATALTPAAATMAAMAVPAPEPAASSLAWSQAEDIPDVVPEYGFGGGWTGARPQIEFIADPQADEENARLPWYRRPALVLAAAAVGALAAVGGVGIALTTDSSATSASSPVPSIPPSTADDPAPQPLAALPPAPSPVAVQNPQPAPMRTVTAVPPPVTRTQVVRGQAPAPQAPPPATSPKPASTPPPTTTTAPPPTTTAPPPTTTTPPPTTTTPPPPETTTPPPPVTETVTETVQPSSEAPAPPPEPEAPAPEPPVAEENPTWTMPPLPTIPGLPPLVPAPSST